jgi:Transposase IS66 family
VQARRLSNEEGRRRQQIVRRASGLAAKLYRRTATAKDARRPARRFRFFEDMILRFATRPDLDIFSNEAERTIRSVKVQQRSSGACRRTLTGLADCALVECVGRIDLGRCCSPSSPASDRAAGLRDSTSSGR